MNKEQMFKQWNSQARDVLVGRTITKVMYMNDTWAEQLGFDAYMLQLDNGTIIIPMRDDEGNDGGAVQYLTKEGGFDVLPLLR
jgi:hypothetical protein